MHCGESLPSCHGPELAKILVNASAEELGHILEISRKSLDISKKLKEFRSNKNVICTFMALSWFDHYGHLFIVQVAE